MAYEGMNESPLDYKLCLYGQSKILFRGPRKDLKKPYHAFLGGTEMFGKYIEKPFASLVEDELGTQVANFGAVNAGIDAFVKDPSLLKICDNAKTTVIQVMGAHNMSNRFYSVHPRRNDRFLKASTLFQTIFREIDFTEFSFTRHLLMTLKSVTPEKFSAVEDELKEAWVARMRFMLRNIAGQKVLLWLRDKREGGMFADQPLGQDPLFVDADMIDEIREMVDGIVEVDVTNSMAKRGTFGMMFPQLEAAAAEEMFGLDIHDVIAKKLVKAL
ncbi:DUF6473 family protein [Litoreibacter roseus]|uniref:DUF6473 domain-containing protein n=1 Tax=Litoreibacter roseus TaxID=2601869 RepID=A0A6N6JMJ9_9RHOB|nr:DUF6473 family protein [Litoreibacter roseus]GFE66422.1 hypothetical protein KIN_34960 [Litoreibacter roseus]